MGSAAEDALRADIWDGDPEDIPPTMGREAELAVAAALPAIEKQIREQVAADIWEYWPFRRTARAIEKQLATARANLGNSSGKDAA